MDADQGNVYGGGDPAAGEGGVPKHELPGETAGVHGWAGRVEVALTPNEARLNEVAGHCPAPNRWPAIEGLKGMTQMQDENKDELLCGGEETGMERALERLAAAAEKLERAFEKIAEREASPAVDAEAYPGRIVATVEGRREAELEQRLAAAETELGELRARAATSGDPERGRKTVPASVSNLLAKQGAAGEPIEGGALDAALVSLSLEQRIAVKAQLMRSGLLG